MTDPDPPVPYTDPNALRAYARGLDVLDLLPRPSIEAGGLSVVDPDDPPAAPFDEVLLPLIERASVAIDNAVGAAWARSPDTGRRFNVDVLTAPAAVALSRATCAAALFLLAQGGDDAIGADDRITGVPGGVSFAGAPAPRPPGPLALEELEGFGLLRRSGTVEAVPSPVSPMLPPAA